MGESESPRFIPASALTLEAFAQLYTRSFERYFYPMEQTTEGFAARVRNEQLDLYRSVALMMGDRPAGQATLALRGERAWCGGFGIVPEFRGQRLGPPLFAELVAQARKASAKILTLEALTRNAPALSVYTGAGMRVRRDVRLLEWKRAAQPPKAVFTPAAASMAEVAGCFYRLHPVPAVWGRDLPSLLLQHGLLQLHASAERGLDGYVLFTLHESEARIADLAANHVEVATALLAQLQTHCSKITSINEPADSPLTAAFDICEFTEFDRQHELAMAL